MRLRVQAPFAAFRTFTAGSYRPSSPFIPPSAAYGLLLNLAGVESRWDDGKSPMTLMRSDLPTCTLAVGAVTLPEVHTLYQQLHNYPVGATGKERVTDCKGAKYNIQPVRREFLSRIDALICVRDNDALCDNVREGLLLGTKSRRTGARRYGVPFLGDNSHLIDRVWEEPEPSTEATWYVRVNDEPGFGSRVGRTRLTLWIDRKDMSKTRNAVFASSEIASCEPPVEAWVEVGPASEG